MAKAIASNTGGYGDIFAVNTPYIDRFSQQLALEEKQREMQQQRAAQLLNEQMSKNLTAVRPADVGLVTQKYNDWKSSAIDLMKKKNVTPQDRLALLAKKADLYSTINGSKQQKDYEQGTLKGYQSNPDKYEDDTHNKLMQSIQTPYDQLGDLRNYDYTYKGTNTDFGTLFKNAAGTPKTVYTQTTPMDKEGLQSKVTPYEYGNTPLQYHDILMASLAKHGAGRDAAAIVEQWTPDVIKSVQDQYNAIPPERWQQMGVDKPQDLEIKPDDSKAEIFAKHNAQLYALNNEPKQGKPTTITNAMVKRNLQLQDQKTMEGTKYRHSIDRLYTAANLKQNKDNQTDVEDAGAVLKDVYDNINSGIQNNTAKGLKGFLGMKPTEGPIEVSDPNVIKDFSSVRKVGSTPMPPDKVLFDTKRDQFSLYYAPIHFDATNSSPAMDVPATTIPMSGRDYIKLKIKETYPNKDIGNINRIVDKVITEKGGLYNAVKDIYGNANNTQSQSKPIQLSGKVDPAQLRVNQAYNVNGKTYIWDGKKLKAQ